MIATCYKKKKLNQTYDRQYAKKDDDRNLLQEKKLNQTYMKYCKLWFRNA